MKLRNKKTGEIVGLSIYGIMLHIRNSTQPRYYSISELNAEWEDYKPPMPKIENKVVRKIIREWAEVCGVKKVTFYIFGEESEFWNDDNNNMSISFNCPLKLEEGRAYTIPELCGEDER